jgi:hypothetical protein
MCGQAARRGVVAGWAQARHRRSWPLPGRATILGHRLAGSDRSPLPSASYGRRVKNACCKHMFQVFKMFHRYVASVSYECCKSRCDVAYVAMVVHICCKFLLSMFHLCFYACCKCVYLDVAYVSHIDYKCFIWMLCMFASVFHVFLQVFHTHILNVSFVFRCMFQVFHRNVLKLDGYCTFCNAREKRRGRERPPRDRAVR